MMEELLAQEYSLTFQNSLILGSQLKCMLTHHSKVGEGVTNIVDFGSPWFEYVHGAR